MAPGTTLPGRRKVDISYPGIRFYIEGLIWRRGTQMKNGKSFHPVGIVSGLEYWPATSKSSGFQLRTPRRHIND